MNVKEYQYLLLIEKHGNLSKAAEEAGITQPALSKFLKGLESRLGCRLFDRSGKNLVPTTAGSIYLDTCRKVVDIKKRTYSSILHFTNNESASIRINVTPHRGIQMFGKISSAFYEKYPETNLFPIEGYTSQNKESILNEDSDLALGTITPDDERVFDFASTSYDELILAVPVSHPAASLSNDSGRFFPSIDIKRFYDTPFVMWGNKTTNKKVLDKFFERTNFKPTVIYEGNDMQVINELLKTGVGAGFLPKEICAPGQNRVYFSIWPPLMSFLGVYFKKGKELSEEERYIIYLLLKITNPGDTASQQNVYFNELSQKIIKEFEPH